MDSKTYTLCVRRGEFKSVQLLKSEVLDNYKAIEEWGKTYSDLENEMKKITKKMNGK